MFETLSHFGSITCRVCFIG